MLGCIWVIGKVRRWDAKARKYYMAPCHCNKLVAPNSEYCPKHLLTRSIEETHKEAKTYAEGK